MSKEKRTNDGPKEFTHQWSVPEVKESEMGHRRRATQDDELERDRRFRLSEKRQEWTSRSTLINRYDWCPNRVLSKNETEGTVRPFESRRRKRPKVWSTIYTHKTMNRKRRETYKGTRDDI